jgi:putative transposase
MIKTYTYKIRANNEFVRKFNYWAGACRFLYNCALELKSGAYKERGIKFTNYDLYKQLTEAKQDNLWLFNIGNRTLRATLDRLDYAFNSFYRGGGYPKFANKKKWRSIPFQVITFHKKQKKFYLQKWGYISIFKDRMPEGKLKTASIVKKANGYYLHVTAEVEYENTNENQVGIDMGLSKFAVTSDGKIIENPRHFQTYEKRLRILQKSLSRKKKGSNSRKKCVNKLAKLYLKISRIRRDFLHKASSGITKESGIIFMENLNVQGMSQSNLAKHILDCGWSEFRIMLSYKATVIAVNPAYTSQTCNVCANVDKENRKTQSEFKCTVCGHEENADLNAAKNIKEAGARLRFANVSQ